MHVLYFPSNHQYVSVCENEHGPGRVTVCAGAVGKTAGQPLPDHTGEELFWKGAALNDLVGLRVTDGGQFEEEQAIDHVHEEVHIVSRLVARTELVGGLHELEAAAAVVRLVAAVGQVGVPATLAASVPDQVAGGWGSGVRMRRLWWQRLLQKELQALPETALSVNNAKAIVVALSFLGLVAYAAWPAHRVGMKSAVHQLDLGTEAVHRWVLKSEIAPTLEAGSGWAHELGLAGELYQGSETRLGFGNLPASGPESVEHSTGTDSGAQFDLTEELGPGFVPGESETEQRVALVLGPYCTTELDFVVVLLLEVAFGFDLELNAGPVIGFEPGS